jgi:riboflavin synthase
VARAPLQGHVDTTATLRSVTPVGNALTLVLRLNRSAELPRPSELSPYLIPKGYVTLDGASLTLIDVSAAEGGALDGGDTGREVVEFSVMLISHTQEMIGLSAKQAGEAVNVELDVSCVLFRCPPPSPQPCPLALPH